jgi:hypothetical protein
VIQQRHHAEKCFLKPLLVLHEQGYSKVKDKLGRNLFVHRQFFDIGHLLKYFAFMLMDAPVAFLALLRAVVKALTGGT